MYLDDLTAGPCSSNERGDESDIFPPQNQSAARQELGAKAVQYRCREADARVTELSELPQTPTKRVLSTVKYYRKYPRQCKFRLLRPLCQVNSTWCLLPSILALLFCCLSLIIFSFNTINQFYNSIAYTPIPSLLSSDIILAILCGCETVGKLGREGEKDKTSTSGPLGSHASTKHQPSLLGVDSFVFRTPLNPACVLCSSL